MYVFFCDLLFLFNIMFVIQLFFRPIFVSFILIPLYFVIGIDYKLIIFFSYRWGSISFQIFFFTIRFEVSSKRCKDAVWLDKTECLGKESKKEAF